MNVLRDEIIVLTVQTISGKISGEQAGLHAKCLEALYVHCSNYSMDLNLQEATKRNTNMPDALQFVNDMQSVIRESAKHKIYV